MAKFKVAGKTEVKFDDNGGTLRSMTAYVDTIEPVGKEFDQLDVTSFADTAERVIAGIELSQEFAVEGHFDDTATTGPDAVFAPLPGTLGSFEFFPVGTSGGDRKFSCETLCLSYKITGRVKERVNYTARFKQDNAMTVGTA